MKSHAIIPIFIPHKGCSNACVFCDQNQITAGGKSVQEDDVAATIEKYLCTLTNRNLAAIEVAFYGGSFTGLPAEEQSRYLETAHFYKRRKLLDKIRLSTRPDYINDSILSNLERYGVDTIELGVQSFDDSVLKQSNRGHDSSIVYESSRMIHDRGFELGIQLMIGLPGDTPEKDVHSANELVKIKPSVARLYPTVVIEGTELHRMARAGLYVPLTLTESVNITKKMYKIISAAGINIIRVGLRSADLIAKAGEHFHPAFRQLVESEIAKDALNEQIEKISLSPDAPVRLFSNEKSFSNMIGHRKSNKDYFGKKYPLYTFSYEIDNALADNEYAVKF